MILFYIFLWSFIGFTLYNIIFIVLEEFKKDLPNKLFLPLTFFSGPLVWFLIWFKVLKFDK